MTNDRITTVMGAILACITAMQPVVNAIDGTFGIRDAFQVFAAGLIAGLGYYIQKKGEKPPAEPVADTSAKTAPITSVQVAELVHAELLRLQKKREEAKAAALKVTP